MLPLYFVGSFLYLGRWIFQNHDGDGYLLTVSHDVNWDISSRTNFSDLIHHFQN